MRRREFLLGAAGAGGAIAATSGSAGATDGTDVASSRLRQQGDGEDGDGENGDGEDGDGEAEEVVVELVDFAFEPGTDEPIEIEPGTLVRFVWETSSHNIAITNAPDDTAWEGEPDIQEAGYEHEHTFETEGEYEFVCEPHINQDMDGSLVVEEGITEQPAAPPAEQELDPHEIGVPLQKHFIGIATFFSTFLTLVFAFYVLKYGESPHSGSPNRR